MVLLEKITSSLLVKNPAHLIEPESSLPLSQVPVACPYPKPHRFNPYPHILIPEDPS
jgi:hypothetical protein